MPRRFRPRLVPTLTAIPMLLVLLGLGLWQVQRHEWKSALNAERLARFGQAAVALPAEVADPAAFDLRSVMVEGRFDHGREMLLQSRSRNGEAGVEVIAPLLRLTGAPVLVNRGFVPLARTDPARRSAGQVAEIVSIQGVLRLPGRVGYFVPANDPARGLWFSIDVAAMARTAGLVGALPLVVEAGGAASPGGLPVPFAPPEALHDPHLSYALTWFALALALVVVYLVYHLQIGKAER
ncbi:MAG: SURF1 family protein [Alphaproteobacteria bacterium]|nr:SURF1 family protein [Alphaproteobacteria bacterium]